MAQRSLADTHRSGNYSSAPNTSVEERAMLQSVISMAEEITSCENTQRWNGSNVCLIDHVHIQIPFSLIEVAKEIIDASVSTRRTKTRQRFRSMVLTTAVQGTPKPHHIRFALPQLFDLQKFVTNALSMLSLLNCLLISISSSPVSPVPM